MAPHSDKPDHWDFMLESEGRLLTWNLQTLPAVWAIEASDSIDSGNTDSGNTVDATAIDNHRLAYLDYEGPITDDRGTVRQCDPGTYEATVFSPDEYRCQLAGKRLCGEIVFVRHAGDSWRLTANSD